MALRIIIFDNNDKLRESLVFLLSSTGEYEVVGDYNNCMDAGNITRVYRPDVVLMDIDMPGVSGIKGIRLVKEARPDTAVIMFTVLEDDEHLFQCLCAGADGYLLKKTSPSRLFDAIYEVMEGGAPMSPSIARRILGSFQRGRVNRYSLTSRELEVLTMLTGGYSTKMIASGLEISFETARSHLKNIYIKLRVGCGKEAISKALKEHVV